MNDIAKPADDRPHLRGKPGEQPTDADRATVEAYRRYVAELTGQRKAA